VARSFNGTTDTINLTLAPALPITVAAWINTTTTALGEIVDCDTGAAGGRSFQMRVTAAGKLEALFFTGGSPITTTGTTAINSGGSHHVAATCPSSGTFLLYVDGVLDATSSSHGWAVAGSTLSVGSHNHGASTFYKGMMWDAVMYNGTQLAANQILELANGLPASHLGVSHYWPLWGADSPEPDIGTAAHATGTLTGTTAVAGARVSSSLFDLG